MPIRSLPAYTRRCGLLVLALFVFISATQAQAPVPLPNPNLDFRATGDVFVVARQPDGGIIVGGIFSAVNGVPRRNLARFKPDGELDMAWDPAPENYVYALAIGPDGSVFVGGSFARIGGELTRGLAKLPANGVATPDPNWRPMPNYTVRSLVMANDGSLYVAGRFTQISGVARSRLAKLSTTSPATVDPVWQPSADSDVFALAVEANGSVLIGGYFTSINGVARNHIARVAGSGTGVVDPLWNPDANDFVWSIAVDSVGGIYAAGGFNRIGGLTRNHLSKIGAGGQGVVDPNWNPDPNTFVRTVRVGELDAIYISGYFTRLGTQPYRYLARVSNLGVGAVDTTWNPAPNGGVRMIVPEPNGALAVGHFAQIGGQPRLGFAQLDVDASAMPSKHVEQTAYVNVTAVQSDGGVIVGGSFDLIDNQLRAGLARLRPNSTLDTTWNASLSPLGVVEDIKIAADGSIFVGGAFGRVGDYERSCLAKISADGTVDPLWSPSANAHVRSLALSGDGSLFVGGHFSQVGDQQHAYLAKISAVDVGVVDPLWQPRPSGYVQAIVLAPDGGLIISGNFYRVGGIDRGSPAKVSGTGGGMLLNDWGYAGIASGLFSDRMYVPSDGFLYMLDSYGMSKTPVNTGQPVLQVLSVPSPSLRSAAFLVDGTIFIGGGGYSFGNPPSGFLARVPPTGSSGAAWSFASGGPVNTIAIRQDETLVVGGGFDSIGGQPRQRLATLPSQVIDLIFASGFETR